MSKKKKKKILGEDATEQQITNFLNVIHLNNSKMEELRVENEANKIAREEASRKAKEYEEQLATIEKEKMSDVEKLELAKKEAEENLANSRRILSKAKAQEILSTVGITDEDIIKTVVSEDLDSTVANAQILANKFKFIQDETVKKTKEELANIDVKPNPTNVPQNDNQMTWEKFTALSVEEQSKFEQEHPDEFAKL